MIQRFLKSCYREIPTMACESGCLDCCIGYAPAMSKWEWEQINHPGKIPEKAMGDCPFLTPEGCSIYAKRPLICRLFGAVSMDELQEKSLVDILPVACRRGCLPDKPLPVSRALDMLVMWQRLIWRQFATHFLSWGNYLEQNKGIPIDTIPPKFQWFRYMLAIPEGRRAVYQDILEMDRMPMGKHGWVDLPKRPHIDEIEKLRNVLQS